MDENELKTTVAQLLADDIKLNDIQKILRNEHNHTITFMDLRILSADLQVNWAKFDPKAEEPEEEVKTSPKELTAVEQTIVEVSKIQRPGAMFSGTVTFLSGLKGEWFVDQQGQLGVQVEDESQQPSDDEMADFQQTLRAQLS